jgi:hypothetical protein
MIRQKSNTITDEVFYRRLELTVGYGTYEARFSGAIEGYRSCSAPINFEVSNSSPSKNFDNKIEAGLHLC